MALKYNVLSRIGTETEHNIKPLSHTKKRTGQKRKLYTLKYL